MEDGAALVRSPLCEPGDDEAVDARNVVVLHAAQSSAPGSPVRVRPNRVAQSHITGGVTALSGSPDGRVGLSPDPTGNAGIIEHEP